MAKALSISGTVVGTLPNRLQMSREVGYINNTGYTLGIMAFDGHVDVIPSVTGRKEDHGLFNVTVATKAQHELLVHGLNDDSVSWTTKSLYRNILDIKANRNGSDAHINNYVISMEDILGTEGIYINELDIVVFNARQEFHPIHPRRANASASVSLVPKQGVTLQIEYVTDTEATIPTFINIGETPYEIKATISCSRLNGCYITVHTEVGSVTTRYEKIGEFLTEHETLESATAYVNDLPAQLTRLEKENVELKRTMQSINSEYLKANTELVHLKYSNLVNKEFVGGALSAKDRGDDATRKLIEANTKITEIEVKANTDVLVNNRKLAGDLLKFTPLVTGLTMKRE